MRLRNVTYTPNRDYATVAEAAKSLGVPSDLLRALVRGGQVDAVQSKNKRGNLVTLVPRAEVERLRSEMS